MRQPYSEALGLHLERARDRERGLEPAWCANYWRGVPEQGVGVEGLKEPKKPQSPPKCMKTALETGWFPTLIHFKIAKT